MSLHPLREKDEVRDCPGCLMCKPAVDILGNPIWNWDRLPIICRGTGQLGNPDAEKVIEVFILFRHWRWRHVGHQAVMGEFSTKAEALAAARAALGGGESDAD